ncbi:PREDICTED: uncharacterized protein LOC105963319 [Erythranthe guttata]|uniref:uncharacterized protein LOC105963319 n=1 Tax=Erythranthe guttata TaxID=4155 RepID=UPI00064DBECD|nr:PREDICTED: uncharacterized protein LOC105963319 [Erythranthe guttata]|eukprot:XP_012843165.1 PREDICTED: uncharacterized protein LOC105963319 [Erythranthe guttata]
MEQINSGYINNVLLYDQIISDTIRDHPAPSHPEFIIGIHFYLQPISQSYVVNVDSGEPELTGSYPYPTVEDQVFLKLCDFLNRQRARDIIREKLSQSFMIGDEFLHNWIEAVLEKTRAIVGSMPAEHNIVLVVSPARFSCQSVYDPRLPALAEEETAVEEYYEDINYMVRAAEDWIDRVLVKRTVAEYSSSNDDEDGGFGTCTVCLEGFSNEAYSMPCGHYFHGDCIREWLRTSHSCPVCRYEVPTITTTTIEILY